MKLPDKNDILGFLIITPLIITIWALCFSFVRAILGYT